MIERDEVIKFSDNDKAIVLDVIVFEGETYALTNQITQDEEDVTDVYYIIKAEPNSDNVVQILDKDLLNKLLPMFSKRMENVINTILKRADEIE